MAGFRDYQPIVDNLNKTALDECGDVHGFRSEEVVPLGSNVSQRSFKLEDVRAFVAHSARIPMFHFRSTRVSRIRPDL